MISERMEKLLNGQFHYELAAANQYLAISSWFERRELDGFAHFFRLQAQEELSHAMKQFDYLHQVDGAVEMEAIPKPRTQFTDNVEVFDFALNHERNVTKSINMLMKAAVEEGDFATQTFLQWFVQEQVEEEALVSNILGKLRMIGDNSSALFLMNEDLGRRMPAPETTSGAK